MPRFCLQRLQLPGTARILRHQKSCRPNLLLHFTLSSVTHSTSLPQRNHTKMERITDKIAALHPNANYFSLEFFPPKTQMVGLTSLLIPR